MASEEVAKFWRDRQLKPVRIVTPPGCEEVNYGGGSDGVGDLWTHRIEPNWIVAVFDFTEQQRAIVASGGRLELHFMTEPIPPSQIIILEPAAHTVIGPNAYRNDYPDLPDPR